MKIDNLSVENIVMGKLTINHVENQLPNWIIDVIGSIDKQPLDGGRFIQNIEVKIVKNTSDRRVSTTVNSQFNIKITGKISDTFSDSNFWDYAELIQVAMCHARSVFNTTCAESGITVGFFALEPINSHYEKLKSGYYKIWN